MVVIRTLMLLFAAIWTVEVHGQVNCTILPSNGHKRPGYGQCCRFLNSTHECGGPGGICWSCAPGTFVDIVGPGVRTTSRCNMTWGDPPLVDGTYRCSNACPLGRYQPATGASSCLACEVGRFQNITGQTFCFNCSAGRVSATGMSSCTLCGLNRIPNAAQSSCVNCPAGSWTVNLTGQSVCTLCLQDTSATAGLNCSSCSPGTFS